MRFCQDIVPTAVRDFITKITAFPEKKVIDTDSENRIGACESYSRNLESLGYMLVRGQRWKQEQLDKECVDGNIYTWKRSLPSLGITRN
jgi:hypothetical protein